MKTRSIKCINFYGSNVRLGRFVVNETNRIERTSFNIFARDETRAERAFSSKLTAAVRRLRSIVSVVRVFR